MEKSYVSLEQHICPVCLKTFDTGNLLFDEQLRNIFERYTVTGYELCEEHKKVIEDGYVILVEVREKPFDGKDPYRTGNTAYLKRYVAKDIFPDMEMRDVAFVEIGVLDRLREMIVVENDRTDEESHEGDKRKEEQQTEQTHQKETD